MKTIIPLFFSVYNPKNIEIYRFPLHLATKKHQQSRYLLHFAQKNNIHCNFKLYFLSFPFLHV